MDVDAPEPDPAIGETSKEAIDLANRQFDAQQALLAEFKPLYQQQIQFNLDQQAKNAGRSDQAWADYQANFRPLEQKMAATVAGYDTQERRDKAAADAASGVTSSFDQARQSLTESLNSQGIGASSGKGLAMRNAMGIEEAKARAGASDAARRNVESTGLSLLGSATNFGRGMTNSGLQTGQAASANGQGATGNVAGLSGLTGAGYTQALQGYGVGINGLTGLYQAQNQAQGQQNAIFGDILGAAAYGAGSYFGSSKKIKDKGAAVDGKKALAGLASLDVDHWTYKPGEGDEGSHVGPYAEDVQRRFGDRAAPGGEMINMAEMGEINRKAIGELTRELKALNDEIAELEKAHA